MKDDVKIAKTCQVLSIHEPNEQNFVGRSLDAETLVERQSNRHAFLVHVLLHACAHLDAMDDT